MAPFHLLPTAGTKPRRPRTPARKTERRPVKSSAPRKAVTRPRSARAPRLRAEEGVSQPKALRFGKATLSPIWCILFGIPECPGLPRGAKTVLTLILVDFCLTAGAWGSEMLLRVRPLISLVRPQTADGGGSARTRFHRGASDTSDKGSADPRSKVLGKDHGRRRS
jgi:hypothetical protein